MKPSLAFLLFGISILASFGAWGVVAWLVFWPRLSTSPRRAALTALVAPHLFRFVGLSFLVPGVVSPALPASLAKQVAYGDLTAMGLAFVAIAALARGAAWATAAV